MRNSLHGPLASLTTMRALATRLAIPWRPVVGLLIFTVLAAWMAFSVAVTRPWALLSLLSLPIAAFVVRRPAFLAGLVMCDSLILMLALNGEGTADQLMLGRAALESVLAGENPYRVYDLGTHSNPFAYGPLAMLTAIVGEPLELMSAVAILGVLALSGAWITFGVVAALPIFVTYVLAGINDYTPTLLLMIALVVMRSQPMRGLLVMAVAVALKPYALAWVIPAVGFAGIMAGVWFLIASLVMWAPVLLVWGPASYVAAVRSVEASRVLAAGTQPDAVALNIPWLRSLIVPFSLAGFWLRDWRSALLLGAAGFVAFMLFSPWTHWGYWIVVIPVVGLALEARPSKPHERKSPLRLDDLVVSAT